MKKYLVAIHHKETLAEIGMVCVEAETPDGARSKGLSAIKHHQDLGRIDPNTVLTLAIETYSLNPADWD